MKRTLFAETNRTEIPKESTIIVNGNVQAVSKRGGAFHLTDCWGAHTYEDGRSTFIVDEAKHHVFYFPIHPSMTKADIEGATYVFDDGKHWLFAHCSPLEQIDYAAKAKTFAIDSFSVAMATANVKIHGATNGAARSQAINKLTALVDFAEGVGKQVHKMVIGATLGAFHADPHEDHQRDLTIAAIADVLADWKKRGLSDGALNTARTLITADAEKVANELRRTYSIEWRHTRQARLAAEAKAKKTERPAGDTETSAGQ